MASELRVNSSTNRSGLGTITYTDSGPIVSGVGTFANGLTVDGTQTTVKSLKFTGDNYNANWFKTTNKLRFNDNAKATFGTADDLSLHHDGSHSYIANGTNYTYYLSTQHHFKNAANNELQAKFQENEGVTLYYNNSAKFATTNTGATITGTVTATSFSGNLTGNVTGNLSGNATSATTTERVTLTNQSGDSSCNVLFAQSATGNQLPHTNANLTFNATNGTLTATAFSGSLTGTASGNPTLTSGSNNRVVTATGANALTGEANLTFTGSQLNVTGNISLPDSTAPDYVGNIYVGNNSDLKIFHNGSDNFIRSGAGNANIRIDNNSGVLGARFIPAGAAELYHNGTKMCETSANGLAFPNGKGIDFSATPNAQANPSELFDDYEEGTWTPVLGGYSSISYHNPRIGYYTKIGDVVHFTAYFYVYQATGAASNVTISLPMTSKSDTARESGAYTSYDNGFFDSSWSEKSGCAYLIGSNHSTIRPIKRTNGAVIHGNDTALGTGANNRYLIVAGFFFAN